MQTFFLHNDKRRRIISTIHIDLVHELLYNIRNETEY